MGFSIPTPLPSPRIMLLSTRSSDDDQVIRSLASLELLDLGFPLLLLLFLGFQLYTIVHTHTNPEGKQKKTWISSPVFFLSSRSTQRVRDSPFSSRRRSSRPVAWPLPCAWPPFCLPRDPRSLPFARGRTNGRVRPRPLDESCGVCGWSVRDGEVMAEETPISVPTLSRPGGRDT